MNRIIKILLVVVLFSSCEKVIDIDLNDSDPRFVIDAIIDNDNNSVKLSYSSNFYDDKESELVSGAVVNVKDVNNNAYTFVEQEKGVYINDGFNTIPNTLYSLDISHANNSYKAQSYCPSMVELDSIKVSLSNFSFGDEIIYTLNCYFDDPPLEANYYRLKLYINGYEEGGYYIIDDNFFDGLTISYPFNGLELFENDDLKVELMAIDANVYSYFYTLSRITGKGPDIIPGNPESNIEGNAIGVFSANTYSTKSAVFKEEDLEE